MGTRNNHIQYDNYDGMDTGNSPKPINVIDKEYRFRIRAGLECHNTMNKIMDWLLHELLKSDALNINYYIYERNENGTNI